MLGRNNLYVLELFALQGVIIVFSGCLGFRVVRVPVFWGCGF